MKEKGKLFFKKNIKRKRTWAIIILVVIAVLYFIFRTPSSVANTVTDIAKISDLKETVLATGQVVSSTDLNLSFNGSGAVKSLRVKVGDKVKAGQVLATLEQGAELAALTSARGALAGAEARLKRTIEGSTSEEIALSEITLAQTKLTQDTLISNAYQNLLNSTPEAVPEDTSISHATPTISGTYNLGKEGKIYLKMYLSSIGRSFHISGLTDGTGTVDTVNPQPIGNSGLYIKFPEGATSDVSNWIIEIPNKKASNYLANYNAYLAVKSQAQFAIDQRTAELAIKKSTARSSDIDLANADILSARGQLEAAVARYNNTVITAPLDGTITRIDIKIGELALAQKSAMILQDVSNIYLETNINEANIASLSLGMPVLITYDSFGTDRIFKGNITKIDPSSTLVSGVVNYKVTVSTEQVPDLRPGMTANMTIKVKEKAGVLAIPSRAIVTNDKGERTVRVITNPRKKKWKSVGVTTGIEGDGGMIEVLSGLSTGDEFVILIKK
ncbi:MAG: Efflux transporter, RND family, MFP subunit [Candidatus Nomurabacteria bacterium GW2011_GWC2_36_9]|nr:MAG: Efflux transporter, RND family, MFP subunit [Candidatus Nomurabacteria bacterium GW2011_GWC2_36_9]